jgi:hypothetical protein
MSDHAPERGSTTLSITGEDEPRPVSTPKLVVPYSPTDDGSRPLPTGTPIWACPSIHVNGAPYTGAPLSPDVTVKLSAVVVNHGGLSAWVTTRFYWAEPATGFDPRNMTLVPDPKSVPFYVPTGGTPVESPQTEFTPTSDLPEHLCLFAEATTAVDMAPGTYDPANDRHYAQQNLQLRTAHPGQRLRILFFAVGGQQSGLYQLALRMLTTGKDDPSISPQLIDPEKGAADDNRLRLQLGAWQRHSLRADIAIPDNVTLGKTAQLVIEQTLITNGKANTPTGALSVIIKIAN